MWSKNATYKLCEKIQVEPARVEEVFRFNAIGRCFGMSVGTNSWHVDGHHHFGTSTDTLLALTEANLFGMSAGATLLACRRSFWHVDASYPAFFRVGLVCLLQPYNHANLGL